MLRLASLRPFWSKLHFAPSRGSYAWLSSSWVGDLNSQGRNEAEVPSLASIEDSLKKLKAKNRQLRAELAEMPWPRLESFVVHGKTYRLPYRSQAELPPDSTLEITAEAIKYLAGFFDGDGNVQACGSHCELRVVQSYDHPEVLMMFLQVFGGGIYKAGDGKGLQKPVLVWVLSKSSLAAARLAAHSVTKRRQLDIAATWPSLSSAQRQQCHEELVSLKRYDSGVENSCSWEYVAGFFDAEGSIDLNGCQLSIRLSLEQKFPTVLAVLQSFVERELDKRIELTQTAKAFRLQVASGPHRRFILSSMLDAGLVRKAQQAKLALSLTTENAFEVRRALGELSGNQQFAKRLDEVGLERARKIRNEAGRARRAARIGQVEKAAAILKDVEELKSYHVLQNALCENRALQEYMGRMCCLDPQAVLAVVS